MFINLCQIAPNSQFLFHLPILNARFDNGHALTRKHALVHDCVTFQEHTITRQGRDICSARGCGEVDDIAWYEFRGRCCGPTFLFLFILILSK